MKLHIQNNNNETRNSSIETLKVVALFMIIISHILPFGAYTTASWGINLHGASNSIQHILLIITKYLGQIGNAIFIVCSAFFLTDSKKVNVKKIINIIIDTFVISVMILACFLICDYNLSFKYILKSFFPITFANNWFITAYILYYLSAPLLNNLIEHLKQKSLLKINLFFIVYYFIVQFIYATNYTSVISFIIIHCIISYMKKYMPKYMSNKKLNNRILIISVITFIVSILLMNVLGLNFRIFSNKMIYMSNILNPMIIMIAISLLNIFKNYNFKNKLINEISSLSLLIYLIHDNLLIRECLESDYFKYIYRNIGYENILLICIISSCVVFLVSIILAYLYKNTIQKLNKKILEEKYYIIENKCNILINKILKFE